MIQPIPNIFVIDLSSTSFSSWGYMGRLRTGGQTRILIWPSTFPKSFQGLTRPQSAGEVFSSCFLVWRLILLNWPRFLAAAGPDIHITDYGLGKVFQEILSLLPKYTHGIFMLIMSTQHPVLLKVYTVNRDGSAQTAFGYLGTREGQLSRPAGILLDDR